jgi:hypothetical protein
MQRQLRRVLDKQEQKEQIIIITKIGKGKGGRRTANAA